MPKDEVQKIDTLITRADPLVMSNLQQAMAMIQEALTRAQACGYDTGYGQALCLQGAALFFQSRYPEAQQAYQKARQLGQTLPDASIEARAVNGLGITARALGDYGAAMEFFLISLQLTQLSGDQTMHLRIVSNIGLMNSQLGDFRLGLAAQLEVMASAHALELPVVESAAVVNAVLAYYELGEFSTALSLIDARLPHVHAWGHHAHEILLRTYQALTLLALGQPQKALGIAQPVLQQALEGGNQNSVAHLLITLGNIHLQLGQYPQARDTLEQALTLSERLGLKRRSNEALKLLSDVHAIQGDWRAAYTALLRHQELEHALQEETAQRKAQVVAVTMQVELLKREAAVSQSRSEELEQRVSERTLELQRANEQLYHAAFYDVLTKLGNRSYFQQQLQRAMELCHAGAREGNGYGSDSAAGYGVLFLDTDRFKAINDTLGHDVGDQVLQGVAERLRATVPAGAILARFGGDEFAILLTYLDTPNEAMHLAHEVRHALAEPLEISGHTFLVTAAIGVVAGDSSYHKIEDILRDADIAMYHAKANGQAEIALFTPSMYERQRHRVHLEQELRSALRQETLSVHYQPIVELRSGKVIGLEALARWQHADLGSIAPNTFIAIAEETGLILELDRLILKMACRQFRRWEDNQTTDSALQLSVNISSVQFAQVNFAEAVHQLLQATGVDPAQVHFEITERLVLDRAPATLANLERLSLLGIHFHIDDFGTGYSSLSYLQEFTASTLKIDRSFVQGITNTSKSREIVRTILAMARNLKMSVVAEGVETKEQAVWLQDEGCDYAQGYHFFPPVPAEEVPAVLNRRLDFRQ